MKTAMRELIEWIDMERAKCSEQNFPLLPNRIENKATELLEKEKEQIIEAYKNADVGFAGDSDAVDYYSQTYNSQP